MNCEGRIVVHAERCGAATALADIVHAVEVAQARTADTDILRLTWGDGRIGTVRLIHPESTYGALLFRSGGKAELLNLSSEYAPLVGQILEFARTGKSPIPERETLEIFEVMAAAQESLNRGGAPIRVEGSSAKH